MALPGTGQGRARGSVQVRTAYAGATHFCSSLAPSSGLRRLGAAAPARMPEPNPSSHPKSSGPAMSLYTTYLDMFQRRLKKGQALPPSDAAGLVNGTRFHGRGNPMKGKGIPPPDQREEAAIRTKTMIAGRSHMSDKFLLDHPESAESARPGTAPPAAELRTSGQRICDSSYRTQLVGAGIMITSEPLAKRAYRRPGSAAPTHKTAARVLCIGEEEEKTGPAQGPPRGTANAPRGVVPHRTALLTSISHEHPVGDPTTFGDAFASQQGTSTGSRPQTAPAVSHNTTEARRSWQAGLAGHNDVFDYRYSSGICPPDMRMTDTRIPSPTTTQPSSFAARTAYTDSRQSYNANKIRSMTSHARYA
ncbi:MAG: hypothetical protein WDW36_008717 [Sanguina aurantia]